MAEKLEVHTLTGRIEWLANLRGKTPQDIAAALKIEDKAVYQWYSGATKGLKPENLVNVAKLLDTTVEWLVLEEEPMERPSTASQLVGPRKEALKVFDSLPEHIRPAMLKVMREFAHTAQLLMSGKA